MTNLSGLGAIVEKRQGGGLRGPPSTKIGLDILFVYMNSQRICLYSKKYLKEKRHTFILYKNESCKENKKNVTKADYYVMDA